MDLTEFERVFNLLQSDLSRWLDTNKSHTNMLLYENYLFYFIETKSIIERIEKETALMEETSRGVVAAVRRREDPKAVETLMKAHSEAFILLRVDVKTFFLFTQVFLDTLARVIRESYGRRGQQLDTSMTGLLSNNAAMDIDAPFFSRLRENTAWYCDFNDRRDSIAHWLGAPRFTATKTGDLGVDFLKFDIKKAKERTAQREKWGSDTVSSILGYVSARALYLDRLP
jgi:hypothetical protein